MSIKSIKVEGGKNWINSSIIHIPTTQVEIDPFVLSSYWHLEKPADVMWTFAFEWHNQVYLQRNLMESKGTELEINSIHKEWLICSHNIT